MNYFPPCLSTGARCGSDDFIEWEYEANGNLETRGNSFAIAFTTMILANWNLNHEVGKVSLILLIVLSLQAINEIETNEV